MIRSLTLFAAAAALAAAVSGCSLLSTPDPIQLYRFGAVMEPPPQVGDTPAPLNVSMRPVELPKASADDRLLSVTGTETAYIGAARWVSPAEDLFEASLEQAFAQRADRVRLLNRREPATAPAVLSVQVNSFETRYDVVGGTPVVVITARAQLRTRTPADRTGGRGRPEQGQSVERTFTVTQPATENRVTAIVTAYDLATRDITAQIVDWTIQPR